MKVVSNLDLTNSITGANNHFLAADHKLSAVYNIKYDLLMAE